MAVTKVASATTAGGVQVLAPNAQRKGFTLENSDANRCRVYLGSGTVSATDFSFTLAQNENSGERVHYTGEVRALWDADGSGYLHVTEW